MTLFETNGSLLIYKIMSNSLSVPKVKNKFALKTLTIFNWQSINISRKTSII